MQVGPLLPQARRLWWCYSDHTLNVLSEPLPDHLDGQLALKPHDTMTHTNLFFELTTVPSVTVPARTKRSQ